MPRGAKPKLYYNPEMSTHTHPWAHVEKRTRASDVYEHLDRAGLLGSVQVLPGHSASDEELRTVHTQRHIDEVGRMTAAARADPTNRELCEPNGPGGVYYSGHADAAARLACGCVIDAAVGVLQDSKNATATRASPGDCHDIGAGMAVASVEAAGTIQQCGNIVDCGGIGAVLMHGANACAYLVGAAHGSAMAQGSC